MKNKNPNITYLYQLPAFQEFLYRNTTYRTITEIKQTVVNTCHTRCTREVLNLLTSKAITLPYFTEVTIFQNK